MAVNLPRWDIIITAVAAISIILILLRASHQNPSQHPTTNIKTTSSSRSTRYSPTSSDRPRPELSVPAINWVQYVDRGEESVPNSRHVCMDNCARYMTDDDIASGKPVCEQCYKL